MVTVRLRYGSDTETIAGKNRKNYYDLWGYLSLNWGLFCIFAGKVDRLKSLTGEIWTGQPSRAVFLWAILKWSFMKEVKIEIWLWWINLHCALSKNDGKKVQDLPMLALKNIENRIYFNLIRLFRFLKEKKKERLRKSNEIYKTWNFSN